MSSIEDVAKKARVSVTTVSRALNDHPYVSAKTKNKIFKAMEELNYYPNNVAQQLRGKGSKMIGVIISYITNPFFAYLVDAIETTALDLGYHLVVMQTRGNQQLEKFYIEMIKKKQLDGIIITNLETATKEVMDLMNDGKIVLCNRYIGDEELPVIQIDEAKASYMGTEFLIKKGHTKIAFCTGNIMNPHDHRFKGFLEALTAYGLTFKEEWFFDDILGIEGGRAFVERFSHLEDPPTAVFSNGDEVAAGIISESRKFQIRVPEDLAVLGFDDQPIASITYPQITTIQQPIHTMGENATKMLIAKIESKEVSESLKDLHTELIIRDSI